MTYSALIDQAMPPTNRKWSSRPPGVRINGLIAHHQATTGLGGVARLVTSSNPASANYIIMSSGTLIGSVPEEYRAWTTGSFDADDDKITVEVQNSTASPTWEVSPAALATLAALYADLSMRYGFPAARAHIFGHRDYAATFCPGDYLYSRLDLVASTALAIQEENDMPSAKEVADAVWDEELPVPPNLVDRFGERISMRRAMWATLSRAEATLDAIEAHSTAADPGK